jgi:hypothetical protein
LREDSGEKEKCVGYNSAIAAAGLTDGLAMRAEK